MILTHLICAEIFQSAWIKVVERMKDTAQRSTCCIVHPNRFHFNNIPSDNFFTNEINKMKSLQLATGCSYRYFVCKVPQTCKDTDREGCVLPPPKCASVGNC